ncbi:MAG: bifunctional phosphoribosyl-AMP cyclohydrolase/phosphoribosyl-ATP diphosphatase HisIE [Chitinophagales bacterium]
MKADRKVLAKLKYDAQGLIPAIVTDAESGQVLMLAYMNREALAKTLETGQTWFWSRSRQELWWKGATSGHYQLVQEITADCDFDTLLIRVEQVGGIACHEGVPSCFHNPLTLSSKEAGEEEDLETLLRRMAAKSRRPGAAGTGDVLADLFATIQLRQHNPIPESYTNRLLSAGVDRICRKVGEEATEVVIAAKNASAAELAAEAADLLYHLQVLLAASGVEWEAALDVLREREGRHGGDGKGGERPKRGL